MIPQFINSLRPRSMPLMTRQSYLHELIAAMISPVALSLMESGVVGVVAAKVFGVSDFQLAAIVAAPMFGNLTSFAWAYLARGRKKVRAITGLQVGLLVMIALVAGLPLSPAGRWMLTGVVIVARCLTSGVITLRSTVLRMNYPRHMRGRITSRLTMVTALVMAAAPLIGSALLDANPQSFRLIYPIGAAVGAFGVMAFSRVRLRREKELLAFERSPGARPMPHGETGSIYEYHPSVSRPGIWSVLRDDPLFRRFMMWQFLNGASNMLVEPPLIEMVTSNPKAGYMVSIVITATLPTLLAMIALPIWAPYLDRGHIVRFRYVLSWLWASSHLITWAGAMVAGWHFAAASLAVIALGRAVIGVGRGGGVLAWNLGHNDFASRELVAIYMGVNVTLTGVRGAFAPFLGMALYKGLPALTIPLIGLTVPAFAGVGPYVFLIAGCCSAISGLGFLSMYRAMTAADRRTRTPD